MTFALPTTDEVGPGRGAAGSLPEGGRRTGRGVGARARRPSERRIVAAAAS